jgi:hypothetical protein
MLRVVTQEFERLGSHNRVLARLFAAGSVTSLRRTPHSF